MPGVFRTHVQGSLPFVFGDLFLASLNTFAVIGKEIRNQGMKPSPTLDQFGAEGQIGIVIR